MDESTMMFNTEEISDRNIKETLKEISIDLSERGYDPVKQIVGYLISGDPGYISSYKECRTRITNLNRNSILELMLKNYLEL